MKKCNPLFLIFLIALYAAFGCAVGFIIAFFLKIPFDNNWMLLITIPLVLLLFTEWTNLIFRPIAQRTMRKGIEKENFVHFTEYTCRQNWTLSSTVCIDEDNGRVAYVPVLNPFKFQMVNASDLSKVRSSYIPGPMDGTRYVFFEFYCQNERFRFPTFARRSMWVIGDSHVQAAIAEGDKICNLILKFNPDANKEPDKVARAFNKTGFAGFIFSIVSIVLTVITELTELVVSTTPALKENFNNCLSVYIFSFLAIATAVTGLILGVKGLKGTDQVYKRGTGFAKTARTISSILLAILLISLASFIFVK